MQARENELDHRSPLFGVHAKGDAPSIVLHTHRRIGVQGDLDLFTVPSQGLIGRVVQHLLNDVQGIVRAGVHPGTLLDGLESFENTDGIF